MFRNHRFLLSQLLLLTTVVISRNEDNDGDIACELYLAKSTIENAGLGVFTTISRKPGEHVSDGDVCIPLKDLEWQFGGDPKAFVNPFADYVWFGDPLGLRPEIGPYQMVSAFWPGLNAAVNCHSAMLNVERATPHYDNFDNSMHRFKDPSVGSFSPYHKGPSIVKKPIPAGSELFTSYGDKWFMQRLHLFPYNFPVPSSYDKASRFLHRFKRKVRSEKHQQLVYDFIFDLRDNIWDDSRFLQALPHDLESVRLALKDGIKSLFQKNATRSIDYLRKHGSCLDNIRSGNSTIPGASRGAFANRFLAKNKTITVSPLIHILDPTLLDINHFAFDMEARTYTKYERIGYQLVKNYCLGHEDTTILLCPYGNGVGYINHNQSLANVRLKWPKHGSLNHNERWLVTQLSAWDQKDKKSRLAIEYVATRDIEPGEELFLDYGDLWENAYSKHVKKWDPPQEYADYISATTWNQHHKRQDILRSEEEQNDQPYPPSLELRCHQGLSSSWGYKYDSLKWDENLDKYNPEYGHACRVIRRREDKLRAITYDVIITELDESINEKPVEYERRKVPRSAIKWFDKPESTDMHLRDAFRHYIGIPDDELPEAWRNKGEKKNKKGDKDNSQYLDCDMYIADSTIPNAGYGMFTSKPLSVGDYVGNGDVAIMIPELAWHQDEDGDYFDTSANYVWDASSFSLNNEVIGEIRAFWPGINAAVNFNPFLVNVGTANPEYHDADVHRALSPGAGGFSPYHLGIPKAARNVPAGGELFKDYGPEWFKERNRPDLPTSNDIIDAESLLYQFFSLDKGKINESLYGLILDLRKIWISRLLNAFPNTFHDAITAVVEEIATVHQPNAIREIPWLQRNGKCMDHIVPGDSKLENAGHGAFAKRFLPKGTVISGSPLIHFFEDLMDMYDLVYRNGTATRRQPLKKSGRQMMLNYCFGHDQSTLLLCPYGSGVNYINHKADTHANVKIQWAPNGTLGHNSSWLSEVRLSEMKWNYKSSLAIDYIATNDIEEGEELFLDYGPAWGKAWQSHIENWRPQAKWNSHLSAATINKLTKRNPLRTEEEQRQHPYPQNLMLQCDIYLIEGKQDNKSDLNLINYHCPCTILERYDGNVSGDHSYEVRIHLNETTGQTKEGMIPREGIQFYDRPYTSDLHLPRAFRHFIGLPENMVPDIWRDKFKSTGIPTSRHSNTRTDEL